MNEKLRQFRAWFLRFGGLFRKQRRDRELADEIESNLQLHIEDNLRCGMTPTEARRQAVLKFGGVESAKESYRDRRGFPFLDHLLQDIRYGLRLLGKNMGLTVVMVLTLALCVGANTAIFSIVNAVLLRPLPFADPGQLVTIENPGYLLTLSSDEPARFLETKERTLTLESIGVYNSGEVNLTDGLVPARVLIMEANPSFFSALGINPMLGRTYSQEDEAESQNRVAVLSWGFWQSRYGGDTKVLGKTIEINGRNFTVIGVMPQGFQFPAYPGKADLWVPLVPAEHLIAAEGIEYSALSRLKPGVTLREAQAEMDVIFQRLRSKMEDPSGQDPILLVPLRKMFEAGTRPALVVLLGAAGFVLLIACANIANLSLSRAVARQRETAVRSALGADRIRLIRQWLTESLLLALIGGAAGLLLAFWSLKGLVLIGASYLRYAADVAIDSRVLCFTLAVSIFTGILFGLAPSIQSSNPDLSESLKEGAKTSASGFGRSRFRQLIIVVEVALTLLLATGAGLLLRTFENLWRVDPGFSAHHVVTLELSPSKVKYPDAAQKIAFYQKVIERIKAIPGIEAVGSVNHLPLDMNDTSTFFANLTFDDRHSGPGRYSGAFRVVSADYFRVMTVPLLKGRTFSDKDNLQAPGVVVINQTLAHGAFGEEDPIGKHLIFGGGKTGRTFEIIGIVGNIRHWGLDKEVESEFYMPSLQVATAFASLAITSHSDIGQLTPAIRRAVDQVDKDQPISNLRAMDQVVSESLSERRFVMILLGLFSALALVLSAVGIYGMISYSTSLRIQEIGVRMALGARPRNILGLILHQGIILVLSGIGLGILASLGLTRLLAGFLFGVKPTDIITLITVSLILISVAVAACCLPARRAMRVDPMVALRYE
jgi:predicted permease